MVLSEFRLPFLTGVRRSVNRKIRGSNPCSGANFELEMAAQASRKRRTSLSLRKLIAVPGCWRLSCTRAISKQLMSSGADRSRSFFAARNFTTRTWRDGIDFWTDLLSASGELVAARYGHGVSEASALSAAMRRYQVEKA